MVEVSEDDLINARALIARLASLLLSRKEDSYWTPTEERVCQEAAAFLGYDLIRTPPHGASRAL